MLCWCLFMRSIKNSCCKMFKEIFKEFTYDDYRESQHSTLHDI